MVNGDEEIASRSNLQEFQSKVLETKATGQFMFSLNMKSRNSLKIYMLRKLLTLLVQVLVGQLKICIGKCRSVKLKVLLCC